MDSSRLLFLCPQNNMVGVVGAIVKDAFSGLHSDKCAKFRDKKVLHEEA